MQGASVLGRVERHAAERLADAQFYRNNMPEFMRWAWPIDPSHPRALIWNWHIDAICDHLAACRSGQIRRLIINVPPRTLKSWTVSVAFPAWVWASDPWVQFLVTSADRDIVLRDADMHRDLCMSRPYQTMFRPRWDFRAGPDSSKQAAKGYFRNSAGGHRISKPMGSKGTGHNADYVIFDDPLDPGDAFTDKAMLAQHSINAKQRFMTRHNDPDLGVTILIMQRLHELDLTGVFLDDGGWEHVCLPAEYVPRQQWTVLGTYDPRTEKGELLFPKRLHHKFLAEKLVELTTRGYAGQFQQVPAPATGAMVLKKWTHYWSLPGAPLHCLTCGEVHELPEMDYQLGSWDCSFGSKTYDADYVVGQVWGAAGSNAYLQDQCRRKMSIPEMIAAMLEMNQLWPNLRENVVEKKAAGKNVMKTLATEIYGLYGYDPQGQSKEERLFSTLRRWEQGQIFLPHPQLASSTGKDYSWVQDVYVPEILMFNNGRHDDQVDTTSQALIRMREIGPSEGAYMKVLG